MTTKISIQQIITSYNIEYAFIESLVEIGRVEVENINSEPHIEESQLEDFEQMMRMKSDLNLNAEGIDSVLNLLERIQSLQSEIKSLKEKLQFFEEEE